MKEKNIENFLRNINCADPGMGLEEFTNKVISNLPPKETYEFRVIYAVDKYEPKTKPSGEDFIKNRNEFIKNQLPGFKDILVKLNVSYSEKFLLSTLGISIDIELTEEQARKLKLNSKIKNLHAKNPFYPIPGDMLLDR